jgi:hypothetical protein
MRSMCDRKLKIKGLHFQNHVLGNNFTDFFLKIQVNEKQRNEAIFKLFSFLIYDLKRNCNSFQGTRI